MITEVGSELTAVEQPGAKCCFVMPNCFLKTHTMSRQADGTWAGTCVPVALPPRHSPLPPAPFVACMRRTIAGGRVCVCARVRACFQVGSRLLKGWLGCRLGFKRISLSVVSTNELKHMTTDGPMTMTRSAAV